MQHNAGDEITMPMSKLKGILLLAYLLHLDLISECDFKTNHKSL